MEISDRNLQDGNFPEEDDRDQVPVVSFIGLRRPEPVPISSFPAASVSEAPVYRNKATNVLPISKNPMEDDKSNEKLKAKKESAAQVSEVPMDDATFKAKMENFNSQYHDKKYARLGKKLEESNLKRDRADSVKDRSKVRQDPANKEYNQPKPSRSANILDEEVKAPHHHSVRSDLYSQTLIQFVVVLVAVFVMMYPGAFVTTLIGLSAGYAIKHFDLLTRAGMTNFISQIARAADSTQSRIPVVVSVPDEIPDFFNIPESQDYDSPLKPAMFGRSSMSTGNAKDSTEEDALAARAVINEYLEDNELSVPERIHLMRMFKQAGMNAEVGMTVDQMYDLPEDGSGFPMTNDRTAEEVRAVFARSETDAKLFTAIRTGADLMEISPDEYVKECYAGSVDATIARILSPIQNPTDAVNAEQLAAMSPYVDDNTITVVNVKAAMAEHIKRIAGKNTNANSFAQAIEAVRNNEKYLEALHLANKPNTPVIKQPLKINSRSAPKERVRAANVVGSNTEDLNAHNTTHRIISLYSSRINPFLNNAIELHLVSGNYKSVVDIIEAHYLGDVGSTVAQIIENAKRIVAQTQASVKASSLKAASLKAAALQAESLKAETTPSASPAEVKTDK
jgi:hypothetical protein